MSKKLTFCEECREEVEYKEIEKELVSNLKGELYYYTGKEATCVECGAKVYVAEINDSNLEQLYKEFRVKNDIISLEQILEITEKYKIGKRPLSILLGWGEQTFSRYCDGDMPTKQYSAILKRIYEDPEYYLQILEENKDQLKSATAYEKSKQRVEELLKVNPIVLTNRMELIIGYLLNQCEDITPLALQKILYYIQGFYYAFMGSYLFEEDCEAWVHGPVYRQIYYKYQSYRFDKIDTKQEVNETLLSGGEKTIIDSIVKHLGCYSGKTLEAFTHLETPWLATRGELPVRALTDRVIEKRLIGDYFTAVKEKNNMLNPSDIKVYSKKMFEQVSN